MAANEIAVFIPIVGILAGCVVAALAIYVGFRKIAMVHQERLTAMEKGIPLPPEPVQTHHSLLLRGLVWLFIGIAISVFFAIVSWAENERDTIPDTALGLIPIGVGAAYLIVYRVRKREVGEGNESP